MGAWHRANATRSRGWTYRHAILIGSDTSWGGGRISQGLRGGAEDHFVFATTVRDGKLTNIREHIDMQALARAAQRNAFAPVQRRP